MGQVTAKIVEYTLLQCSAKTSRQQARPLGLDSTMARRSSLCGGGIVCSLTGPEGTLNGELAYAPALSDWL